MALSVDSSPRDSWWIGIVVVAFAGCSQHDGDHPTGTGLSAVRIAPAATEAEEIASPPSETVILTYRISNDSDEPVVGLKLGLSCGCEAVGPLPPKIPPGESAEVSFRLRAPAAGALQRQVPLLAGNRSDPILVLNPVLRVKFDPPDLLRSPHLSELTFIEGDKSYREIVLETIERQDTPRWIEELTLNRLEGLDAQDVTIAEFPEADPELVRRRYRLGITNAKLGVGRHSGSISFQTRSSTKPLQTIPLVVKIVDKVAVVPNSVVFRGRSNGSSRRVNVVYRRGDGKPYVEDFDEELLAIRSVSSQAGHIYELSPRVFPQNRTETQVRIAVADGESRTVNVIFEPFAGGLP